LFFQHLIFSDELFDDLAITEALLFEWLAVLVIFCVDGVHGYSCYKYEP